jgi:hypothetical protein
VQTAERLKFGGAYASADGLTEPSVFLGHASEEMLKFRKETPKIQFLVTQQLQVLKIFLLGVK